MHERVLGEEELSEEDIGVIGELREDMEDEMILRVRPP
jgi:hypothetical protein